MVEGIHESFPFLLSLLKVPGLTEAGQLLIPFSSEIERGQASLHRGPVQGLVEATTPGSVATCEQVKSAPLPPPLNPHLPLFTRVALTPTGTICGQYRQQREHQAWASSEPMPKVVALTSGSFLVAFCFLVLISARRF